MNTSLKHKKVETKQIVCKNCSNIFEKPASFIRQHPDTSFCDTKCSGLYRIKEKTCCYCGIGFKNKRRYSCSEECRSKHKHGKTNTRLYKTWENMKQRVQGKNARNARTYSNNNITVCDEWRNSFIVFEKWALANGYDINLSIDRKDNDKGYSPSNCRWVTQKEQTANTRRLWISNTSGFRGVLKRRDKWIAQIMINYKSVYLGTFLFPWTAALARDSYILINNLEHTLNYRLKDEK